MLPYFSRGCARRGWRETNYLPPSLHYAACFPVSASQVLPPTTPTQARPPPPPPSRSPSMQRQVNMSSCEQDKKGERTDQMFQTGKHEFIPSIPIMCTYRQLLAVLLVIVCALITAHCLAAAFLAPGLSELDVCSFCCFCRFCTELTQSPVWPWDRNDTTFVCYLTFCLCVRVHSL